MWAGQLSRYNDWLRAGRSGDRIPVGERFSAPVQTGPGPHPASCTMGTGSFPGVKSGRSLTLTPHPLLGPLVMKGQSYTSTPSIGRTACTEPQCLYKGALYIGVDLIPGRWEMMIWVEVIILKQTFHLQHRDVASNF